MLRVAGYCNGVARVIYESSYNYDVLFLNPSTRKAMAIPNSLLRTPCVRPCMVFGFGSVDDDYKLVAISYNFYRGAPLTANVFSSKTRNRATVTCSWLEPHLLHYYVFSSVFMNGACHWLTNEYDDDGRHALFLLSFHLGGDHVTDKFSAAISFCSRYDSVSLHVYEGCLSMIVQKSDRSEMWVMKEYGEVTSWTKIIESTHFTYKDRIVGFTGRGDIVYNRRGQEELVCYNPTSKITQSVLKVNHHSDLYLSHLVAYKETLVLLNQN